MCRYFKCFITLKKTMLKSSHQNAGADGEKERSRGGGVITECLQVAIKR